MAKIVRSFRLTEETKQKDRDELLNQFVRDTDELEDVLSKDTSSLEASLSTLSARVATLETQVPFAKAIVTTDGVGGSTITGTGFSSVVINTSEFRCIFSTPQPNANYLALTGYAQQASGGNDVVANATDNSNSSEIAVRITDISTGTPQNPLVEVFSFVIVVFND